MEREEERDREIFSVLPSAVPQMAAIAVIGPKSGAWNSNWVSPVGGRSPHTLGHLLPLFPSVLAGS